MSLVTQIFNDFRMLEWPSWPLLERFLQGSGTFVLGVWASAAGTTWWRWLQSTCVRCEASFVCLRTWEQCAYTCNAFVPIEHHRLTETLRHVQQRRRWGFEEGQCQWFLPPDLTSSLWDRLSSFSCIPPPFPSLSVSSFHWFTSSLAFHSSPTFSHSLNFIPSSLLYPLALLLFSFPFLPFSTPPPPSPPQH